MKAAKFKTREEHKTRGAFIALVLAQKEIETLKAQIPSWTPCSESLPAEGTKLYVFWHDPVNSREYGEDYLRKEGTAYQEVAKFLSGRFCSWEWESSEYALRLEDVTHWAPLLPAPARVIA
jgi:hypothetical protein